MAAFPCTLKTKYFQSVRQCPASSFSHCYSKICSVFGSVFYIIKCVPYRVAKKIKNLFTENNLFLIKSPSLDLGVFRMAVAEKPCRDRAVKKKFFVC
jgi:hypothetical protein